MSMVFHKGKWVERYGLTCGYWTNRPGKLDNHVLKHPDSDNIFDLLGNQYKGEKLHQCSDGIS